MYVDSLFLISHFHNLHAGAQAVIIHYDVILKVHYVHICRYKHDCYNFVCMVATSLLQGCIIICNVYIIYMCTSCKAHRLLLWINSLNPGQVL